MKICTKCGTQNEDDAIFCINCRSKFFYKENDDATLKQNETHDNKISKEERKKIIPKVENWWVTAMFITIFSVVITLVLMEFKINIFYVPIITSLHLIIPTIFGVFYDKKHFGWMAVGTLFTIVSGILIISFAYATLC